MEGWCDELEGVECSELRRVERRSTSEAGLVGLVDGGFLGWV